LLGLNPEHRFYKGRASEWRGPRHDDKSDPVTHPPDDLRTLPYIRLAGLEQGQIEFGLGDAQFNHTVLGVARHRYVANPWHIAVEMFVGFAHDRLLIRCLSFCVTANPARRPVAFYQQRIKFTPQIVVYLQHIHLSPLLFRLFLLLELLRFSLFAFRQE
jgi:hypothetical protein